MNKYFEAAIKRFEELIPKNKKSGGYLVNPISKVDAEIIIELTEALRKFGNDEAVYILEEYKSGVKDSEILEQLIQCNKQTNEIEVKKSSDEEQEYKREFIEINGSKIEAKWIYGYIPKDISTLNEESYEIVLNPCSVDATRLPLFANYKFTFIDFETYEETIKTLDKQLEQANVKFVNKKNNMRDE